MPAPRWLAKANRAAFNRIVRLIAPWAPGFGVVIHRGRRSGSTYRTPVNVFRSEGGFVIALTYGRESDWVKNVLAAGGCELQTRRRRHELRSPRLYRDDGRKGVPAPVRLALGAINAYDFLALDIAGPAASSPGATTAE
jgi:deazaflavin-dependent oxidoreductase (nitroreductase family)